MPARVWEATVWPAYPGQASVMQASQARASRLCTLKAGAASQMLADCLPVRLVAHKEDGCDSVAPCIQRLQSGDGGRDSAEAAVPHQDCWHPQRPPCIALRPARVDVTLAHQWGAECIWQACASTASHGGEGHAACHPPCVLQSCSQHGVATSSRAGDRGCGLLPSHLAQQPSTATATATAHLQRPRGPRACWSARSLHKCNCCGRRASRSVAASCQPGVLTACACCKLLQLLLDSILELPIRYGPACRGVLVKAGLVGSMQWFSVTLRGSWPGLRLAGNGRTFLCCSHMGADRLLPGKEGGAQAWAGREMTGGLVRTGRVLRLPLWCCCWCGSKLGGMPAQLVSDGSSSPLLVESLCKLCVQSLRQVGEGHGALAAEAWQPTTRCPSASLGKPVATGLTNKLWRPCRQTC